MLVKTKSLVLISDRLFKKIAEEAEKIFPVKKITWRILSNAIAEAERNGNGETSLVLSSINKSDSSFLSLFIDEIEKNKIKARIIFPLYGEVRQQNKILQILLAKLRRNDSIESGIVIKIDLSFAPVEVKYGKTNGNNGSQQRAFICPEEVILVN